MPHGVVDDAFKARCTESHTREFRARVYRWNGGVSQPMGLTLPGGKVVYDLPIEDGELTLDSTDPHRRRLRLIVPGEEWIPEDSDSPLAPFGQFISLHVRIDMPDGSWSPWVKLGEFPIISHHVSRPDGTSEVEAVDWSHRVNEYGFVYNHSWKGRSRVEAIKQVVDEALPARVYSVLSTANAEKNLNEEQGQITSGTGRWDFVMKVCELTALESFFDRNGDLVIRNEVVDYEGYVTGAGPDIGNEANPVARLVEGPKGSIIGMTPSITRENASNGVWLTVKPTQQGKGDAYKPKTISSKTPSGPAAYGDIFGRITLHRTKEVGKITRDTMVDAQMHADGLRSRRQGVIRRLEIEALPMWWLDPDDKVNVTWRQRMPDNTERIRTETHYVEKLILPMSPAGTMVLTTRQVAVIQLSEPWTPAPEPNPDYVPPPAPDQPSPTPDEPPFVPQPPPVVVLPPAYDLLDRYNSEITANPSTLATFRCYGVVQTIHDGDTATVKFYSDAACTKTTTIKHPNGTSYSQLRIRFIGINTPESSWTGGPEAEAYLKTLINVGSKVQLRADSLTDASASGNVRLWGELFVVNADGSRGTNVQLHMLDGGWAWAFPLSAEPRNAKNRIGHMKVAMWFGRGLFATPSAHHGSFRITVYGNPSGADAGNEYAIVKNVSAAAVNMSGWLFGDPSPLSALTIPNGFTLGAGASVKVWVKSGTNTASNLYMGHSGALWNNDGDIAVLLDAAKRVVEIAHFDGVTTERIPIKPTTGTPVARRIGRSPQRLDFPGVGG